MLKEKVRKMMCADATLFHEFRSNIGNWATLFLPVLLERGTYLERRWTLANDDGMEVKYRVCPILLLLRYCNMSNN